MDNDISKAIADRISTLTPEQKQQVLEFVEGLVPPRQTLWDLWKERLKEIPDEEWDEVPTDASINLDHYLYGAPKK